MTNTEGSVLERERPLDSGREAFLASVLGGLAAPQKTLEAKYFYDARGSRLFDLITELDEYYLTNAETALLQTRAGEIAERVGAGATLVEFGSGSSVKTRILIQAMKDLRAYVPIDISGAHLDAAAKRLAADCGLPVIPLHADYTRAFALPREVPRGRLVGFFPGSTIGNFEPPAASAFLEQARALLGAGARFLVGADLQKDRARLEAAYNDGRGVTADFNLNLLVRINRELGGDFDLGAFRHKAFYNAEEGRIEMHLESTKAQSVELAGRRFDFAAGETIHTENSYKYSLESFAALARHGGWRREAVWQDPEGLFSTHMLIGE